MNCRQSCNYTLVFHSRKKDWDISTSFSDNYGKQKVRYNALFITFCKIILALSFRFNIKYLNRNSDEEYRRYIEKLKDPRYHRIVEKLQ